MIALSAVMVFVTPVRRFVIGELQALGRILAHYFPALTTWIQNTVSFIVRVVGIYIAILTIVSAVCLLLMMIAIIIGSPGLTGFIFALSLGLIILTWLPAGIVLRLFRINKGVIPKTLKTLIAWTAFIGFLGMVSPDIFSFKAFVGASLVALILMGVTAKMNVLDKLILPLVIVMCLVLGWREFFPEDFRSSKRVLVSVSKKFDTWKDRKSVKNEMDAATTYGIFLKDVKILYGPNLEETQVDLKRGTIVKLVSHKNEILVIDGQGFVEIQLAKESGNFFKGPKYLIEAEFIQVASSRDIIPEDDSLLPANKELAKTDTEITVLELGTNTFHLPNIGDETTWLQFPEKIKIKYGIASADYGYKVVYSDGSIYEGSASNTFPDTKHGVFKILAKKQNQFITIVVDQI